MFPRMDNNKISLAMSESKRSMSASYNDLVPKKELLQQPQRKYRTLKK